MSTLSTVPPSLRMTFRNVSNDGATVRSSRVGSRMTMISYGRMSNPSPPMVVTATVDPWQEGRLRRQPAQVTATARLPRNRRDPGDHVLSAGYQFLNRLGLLQPGPSCRSQTLR